MSSFLSFLGSNGIVVGNVSTSNPDGDLVYEGTTNVVTQNDFANLFEVWLRSGDVFGSQYFYDYVSAQMAGAENLEYMQGMITNGTYTIKNNQNSSGAPYIEELMGYINFDDLFGQAMNTVVKSGKTSQTRWYVEEFYGAAGNTAPEANDDAFSVSEAQVETAAAGTRQLLGNVLDDDTDADSDILSVDAVPTGLALAAGTDPAALGFTTFAIVADTAGAGEVARWKITTNFGDAYLAISTDGKVEMWSDGGEDPFRSLGISQSFDLTFTYQATDGSASDTADVTVTVNGTNDAPSDIRLNIGQGLVTAVASATTTGTGAVIGTLAAADPDTGDTHSFEIVGTNPGDRFEIVGNELRLKAGKEIKETDGSFDLTIRVTDSDGATYYEKFTFTAGGTSPNANNTLLGTNSDVAKDGASEANAVVGDDVIFGFSGNDNLNGNGTTLFGTSGDDALLGSAGNDKLYGGDGSDQLFGGANNDLLQGGADNDLLRGGTGNDQFRMNAPSGNGKDAIQDFLTGSNKIGLLQNGDGWNAANTIATADGLELAAADYANRATIQGLTGGVGGDANKVVEISGEQTAAEISAAVATAAAVGAYVLVFNSTTGRGELWFDSDWGDAANRVQVATFEDIDTLGKLTGLSNANFAEWV